MIPVELADAQRSIPDVSSSNGDGADLTGDLSVVVAQLHEEFDSQLGEAVVDGNIQIVANRFTRATIRSFVPLLVRRYSRQRLRENSAA